jgi:hypothetical protein
MEQRFYFRLQSCFDYLLRNAIGYCGNSQFSFATVFLWYPYRLHRWWKVAAREYTKSCVCKIEESGIVDLAFLRTTHCSKAIKQLLCGGLGDGGVEEGAAPLPARAPRRCGLRAQILEREIPRDCSPGGDPCPLNPCSQESSDGHRFKT